MANITNELNSLVNVVHEWFVKPEVQQQYGGNVNQYLEDHGYETTAPGFAQDFHDAAQIAVQPHVNFEATNTAIDNQAGSPVTNIAAPAFAGSPAPAPAPLLATQAAAVPPAPEPQASYATPAEAHQAIQAITEHYNTYYNTYNTANTTNNVDNSQLLQDTSTNTTINADHSKVDFDNHVVTNAVSGDGAFGANVDDGDIRGVAVGERSAAAGGNQNGVATGDGAVAGGHSAVGATGAGSVAGGHDVSGVNTGQFEGTLVGDDIKDSEVQTITGDVDGVAANDSHLDGVNTGDASHGGVINNDVSGPVNTNTGDLDRSAQNFGSGDQNAVTGDNKGIQNVGDGDQNAFQGDGNVGNALGHDATSTIDHSSIATNGSESGNVFDINDSQGIGFGSGAVTNVNESQGVNTGSGNNAFVDSSAQGGDGGAGSDWGYGGGSGGEATGGPVNINFGHGDQTVAQDHSNANNSGEQAVADDQSAASTGGGDATAQNIIDSENVAAVGHDGTATLDQSQDHSIHDSFNPQDSFDHEDNDIYKTEIDTDIDHSFNHEVVDHVDPEPHYDVH